MDPELVKKLGDACYIFLAVNMFWGLFCAILVWRRLAQLRFRNEQQQHAFLQEMNEFLGAGDYQGAMERCQSDERALAQLALLAMHNQDLDAAELRQLVAERLQRDVLAPLENRVSWIITVIRNGPLLGLFGTVLGMMAAFGRIGSGEKVDPEHIAKEISIALVCTAMGLGTAIPLGYVASSINIRIRDLQESLTPALVRFLNSFKAVTA